MHRFEAAGALAPDRAMPLGDLDRWTESAFALLTRAGVLVSSGGDRWYLDRAAWERFQLHQRTRSVVAACLIVLAVSVLLALWVVFAR